MINTQILADKLAISLSLLCAVHCLAFPLLIIMTPSLAATQFDSEVFHVWMLVAVIPTSIYALSFGCKKHKKNQLLFFGVVGLIFLISAIFLGETWEKPLTVTGSCIISLGHYLNYRLCQKHQACCSND